MNKKNKTILGILVGVLAVSTIATYAPGLFSPSPIAPSNPGVTVTPNQSANISDQFSVSGINVSTTPVTGAPALNGLDPNALNKESQNLGK